VDETTLASAEIRILSLDAIIQAKRAMGRPKDLQTVLELEAIRAKRDGQAVEEKPDLDGETAKNKPQ
jgi:hypothetical protein